MWFRVATTTPLTAKLRLNVEVLARPNGSGSYTSITTIQLSYSPTESDSVFDIRKIVHDILPISQLTTDLQQSPANTRQIKISAYETELGDGTPLATAIESTPFWAIKGATDYLKASEISNYLYSEYYLNKFLSDMPRTRTVFRNQPIIVSYANFNNAFQYLRFSLVAKFEDDVEEEYLLDSGLNPGKITTLYFDEELLAATNPGVPIKYITCKVFDINSTPVQLDAITCHYAEAPARRSRHFIWLNNLGGYDFLTCIGLLEQKIKVEGTTYATTIAKNDYNAQESDFSETDFESVTTWKINTGMKTAQEINSFLNFFPSQQAFLFVRNASESGSDFWFLPVTKKVSATFRKDRNYENSLSFEFAMLFNPKTPYPIR